MRREKKKKRVTSFLPAQVADRLLAKTRLLAYRADLSPGKTKRSLVFRIHTPQHSSRTRRLFARLYPACPRRPPETWTCPSRNASASLPGRLSVVCCVSVCRLEGLAAQMYLALTRNLQFAWLSPHHAQVQLDYTHTGTPNT